MVLGKFQAHGTVSPGLVGEIGVVNWVHKALLVEQFCRVIGLETGPGGECLFDLLCFNQRFELFFPLATSLLPAPGRKCFSLVLSTKLPCL